MIPEHFTRRERPTADKLNRATAPANIRGGACIRVHQVGKDVLITLSLEELIPRLLAP